MIRPLCVHWSAPEGGDYSKAHRLSVFATKQNMTIIFLLVTGEKNSRVGVLDAFGDARATFAGQHEGQWEPAWQVASQELGKPNALPPRSLSWWSTGTDRSLGDDRTVGARPGCAATAKRRGRRKTAGRW